MLRDLNLLVLRCRDLEASRRFYECLGVTFEKHAHGGPEHYAFEDERGVFELYPSKDQVAVETVGLGFYSEDLERTSEAFRVAGFEPPPPQDRPRGRTFIIRDPDGRRIEIKWGTRCGGEIVDSISEAEITRRIADVDSGAVQTVPFEEAIKLLDAKFDAMAKEKSK